MRRKSLAESSMLAKMRRAPLIPVPNKANPETASNAPENWKQFQEPDGSVALICMRCLLTIARAKSAAELQGLPVTHACPVSRPLARNSSLTCPLDQPHLSEVTVPTKNLLC